jgi:hypothetical protein
MPIFNSAGLSWADARPALNASAIMAVSVFSRFMLSPVGLSERQSSLVRRTGTITHF